MYVCAYNVHVHVVYEFSCFHRYVTEVLLMEKNVVSQLQSQFITRQLFSVFGVLDLSTDEVGRLDIVNASCVDYIQMYVCVYSRWQVINMIPRTYTYHLYYMYVLLKCTCSNMYMYM